MSWISASSLLKSKSAVQKLQFDLILPRREKVQSLSQIYPDFKSMYSKKMMIYQSEYPAYYSIYSFKAREKYGKILDA